MLKKVDQDIIRAYFEDNSGIQGKARYVVFPESEKDVSEFLKEANEKKLPVTIAGAGTGVAGGRVPFEGVVLATDKMNKILKIHKNPKRGRACSSGRRAHFGKAQKESGAFWDFGDGYAVVQPGVRVEELKRQAQKEGLFYPPDPTEETAFIGGTVATNASGGRGFKYGSTRKYVRRLKVVLADGQILEVKRKEILADKNGWFKIKLPKKTFAFPIPTYSMPKVKNASGYFAKKDMDLIDLFIGAEGTLGVLTEIELTLLEIKANITGILAFFPHDKDALSFVGQAKKMTLETRIFPSPSPLPLGVGIDALSLEYFDRNSLELLRIDFPNMPGDAQAAIFFEQEVTEDREGDILNSWAKLLESHNASLDNVWFGDKEKQKKMLRDFRHELPDKVNEIVKRNKLSKVGTDIAVPDEKFDEMLEFYLKILKRQDIKYVIFGHIGENHLHVNMLPETCEEFISAKKIYTEFVKKAISLGGTVSAEHGIGKLKLQYLEAMYGRKGIEEMVRIKKALDPNCILCVGNIFPEELLK